MRKRREILRERESADCKQNQPVFLSFRKLHGPFPSSFPSSSFRFLCLVCSLNVLGVKFSKWRGRKNESWRSPWRDYPINKISREMQSSSVHWFLLLHHHLHHLSLSSLSSQFFPSLFIWSFLRPHFAPTLSSSSFIILIIVAHSKTFPSLFFFTECLSGRNQKDGRNK